MRLDDGVVDLLGNELLPDFFLVGRVVRADEAALAGDRLDDALALELGVGLGDRVAIDAQLFGERPDRGQRVARLDGARCRGGLHLVDDLQVDRLAGLEVQEQAHDTVIGQ